ncbi:hypothetical protein, partial [Klebsiella pneumoniae]|uniref:hypothetical protein n=1 Tax=Klebsiella pneumoniae TaxID=573 RepID=UPI001C9E645F
KKDKKKAVFNGYAEGVFYKHFHCEKYNAIWSGSNDGQLRSLAESWSTFAPRCASAAITAGAP